MKLTKREAIRECKRLWKEIEESGLSKREFFTTREGSYWRTKGYRADCPLCEYTLQRGLHRKEELGRTLCESYCPLCKQYGDHCLDLGFKGHDKHEPRFIEAIMKLKE